MEENEKSDFRIQEEDFIMEPVKEGSSFFNLVFMKKTKKRNTGEIVIEPGRPMYGLPLHAALLRIVHHKTSKKLQGRTVQLKEFLVEFQKEFKEMIELCHETLPERLKYQ